MKESRRETEETITRRSFLAFASGAIMAFMGTVLAALSLGSALSPAFKPKQAGESVRLGKVDDFASAVPKKVDFVLYIKDGWVETPSPKSVWVVRQKGDEFTVFNSRCTHLGCIVDWKTEKKEPFSSHHWKGSAFYSPCHAGVFDIEGTVIGGPPPRPLDTLEYENKDGELYCRYQDFVVGIPGKEPT